MSEKKEYKIWEKSTTANGKTETVRVEEVENGFIKTITTEEDAGNGWEFNSKKYIYEDNPMEEKSILDKLSDFMKENA